MDWKQEQQQMMDCLQCVIQLTTKHRKLQGLIWLQQLQKTLIMQKCQAITNSEASGRTRNDCDEDSMLSFITVGSNFGTMLQYYKPVGNWYY